MKKKSNWLFVDLVEDKIKNRGIFITVSLMFYVYITWRLIVGFPSINNTPATIDPYLDMPRITFMGIDVSKQRTPQVKITNSYGEALQGVNVTINLVKISTDSTKVSTPICDFDYRSKIEGSLDYIRFHEVCKVELSGFNDITDDKGSANFINFKIARGPEALYTFEYLIVVDEFTTVTSETFSTYVVSEVFELESLNSFVLRNFYKFGKPLSTQPMVKIKDFYGKPIKDKKVIAFSWVESSFDSTGDRNSPSNKKYLSLENVVSEPSDDQGIAKFTNLTITGSPELIAYIHFYCEGVVTVWTNKPIKKNFEDILPPRAISPVLGDFPDTKIEILNDVDRIVVEGNPFTDNPYSLRVSNATSMAPLPGIACYAFLYKALNDTIPNGYQSSIRNHPVKYLKRSIPGIYSQDCENPSTTSPIMEKIHYTDQEGKVTFDDLRFSYSGPIGKYTIGFSCTANTAISKRDVLVQTSIDTTKIKFVQKYPSQVVVTDLSNQEYDFVLIIEVLDSDEIGVPGKYPSQIITTTNNTSDRNNIDIQIADNIDLFEASKDDGVMTIPVKVSKLVSDTLANLTLIIDGINVTTSYIQFYLDENININTISKIEFSQIPISYFEDGVQFNQKFTVKAIAYNLLGQRVGFDGYEMDIRIYFNPSTQAPIPEDFFKLDFNSSITNQEVTFTCMMKRAPTGHFYIGVFGYFKSVLEDPNFNVLMYSASSKLVRLYTQSKIDISVVSGYSLAMSDDITKLNFEPFRSFANNETDEYVEINMGTKYIVSMRLARMDIGLLKNTEIGTPSFEFSEFPPSMKALGDSIRNYFKIEYITTKTNNDGELFIAFTVKYGGIGAYVTYFDFGSCISIPMTFKTKSTLKSIEIITEPDFRESSYDDLQKKAAYAGRTFDYKARIRISVTEGPKSGYIVLAHPQNLTDSIFSLDILPQSQFELDDKKDNYYGWVTLIPNVRYAITDSNGEAQFDALTVWDITGENATCKFYFVVGDRYPGLYLRSNLTNTPQTFIPSAKYEMINQPSKFISAKSYFTSNPKIRVTTYVPRLFYLLNMQLTELYNKAVVDTPYSDYTSKFMSNTVCFLYSDGQSADTSCKAKKVTSKIPNTEQFEVEFKKLQWSIVGTQSNIKMSFASFLQHNTTNAAISQSLSIENVASSINFISDPPEEVSVNQIFKVELAVKINGGAPLPNAKVSCNITKAFDLSKLTSEIFTTLGNSNYNIQKSSMLAPSSKLDETRTSGVTDLNGIAKIYLRVKESPLDSEVRIVCQCGKVVSSPSPKISVLHPIRKITQDKNYEQTVKVILNKDVDGYLNTNVTLDTTIVLNLWEYENAKVDIIKESDFTATLIKKSEVDSIRKANLNVTDVLSTFNNITTPKDVIEEIAQLGTTLMRGIQTVQIIKKQNKNIGNVKFDVKLDGFKATISKISFIASSPDQYGIIFGANGVYTDVLTESCYIKVEDDIFILKVFFDSSESILLLIFYFLVLVFASKMVKGYALFIGILLTGFYIYLVSMKSYTSALYMASVYFFISLVCIYLIWGFFVYFIDSWIKGKEPSYFYIKKRQYFIEYVYQRLNGHPSNFWVNKNKKLGMELKGYYNVFPKYEKPDLRQSEVMLKSIKDEEARRQSHPDMTTSFDEYRAQTEHSLLSDYMPQPKEVKVVNKYTKEELKSLPVDVVPYEELNFFKKFIRIFTPFEVMYKKIWVNDCFIYPQVLLTCIIICFFSMVYLGYFALKSIINFSKIIEDAYDKVYASAYSFIRNAVQRYFSMFKYEPIESDLDPYRNQLNTFSNTVDQLVFAIKLGAFVGLTIAVILVFLNILLILFDYKRRVLQARKGIFEFKKHKIPLQACAGLPGGIISNSVFMFFFIIFAFTLIFSIFAWPLTWKILWYLKWNILSILSGTIINFIVKFIMNKLCYNFDHIKRRTLLSIFDFFLLQLAILAGIVSAITRFGILCAVLFISIMRIDVNGAPDWFSNIIYLDLFNKAYYASILVQHTHNNPIMITFYTLLFKVTSPVNSNKSIDQELKDKINKRKFRRNRLHLWIFLSKNPSLIQYRVRTPPQILKEDSSQDEKSHNSDEEVKADIEENKTNFNLQRDEYEDSHTENSKQFDPNINMSEASYKKDNKFI